jgi:RHS repeat-associated protein
MQKDDQAANKESNSSILSAKRGKSKSKAIEIPSINLPKGGGAIQSIDETFSVNAVNGTAAFSVPLPVSPARGTVPDLKLSYNSGGGNSVFGQGWGIGLQSIKRQTNMELPRYLDAREGADSDTFLFADAEDLVPEFQKEADNSFSKDADGQYIIRQQDSPDGMYVIRFYKPRTEGLFASIERWLHKTTAETKWRVTTKENVATLFGWSAASRIADPQQPSHVFEWLPEFVFDDKGNCTHYTYKAEDATGLDLSSVHNANRYKDGAITYTNRYLSQIAYGNTTPYVQFGDAYPAETAYMYRTVFDYGEYQTAAPYAATQDWQFRVDAFSSYKAGFEIRTTRLCQRVLQFHTFAALPGGSALVRSLDMQYDTAAEQGLTFLRALTSCGYIKRPDSSYTQKHFPPMTFDYQQHAWNSTVQTVAPEDIVHAPAGLDEPKYQFIDLWNEGLSGILTEQGEGWYYKRNLGGGQFTRAQLVSPKPSFTDLEKKLRLMDLDADGSKQLVSIDDQPKGYFELNEDKEWQPFRSFAQLPNIDFKDRHTRMIDITGDGKPDLLITEDHVFTWYESKGRQGYAPARSTPKFLDEDDGPSMVFADRVQTIFLADMAGHGLNDIVRVRNSEVCYWPNLGYGTFGAKVTMDNAPLFDAPDAFNPSFLQLADIDGSGTSDLIYFGKGSCRCWLNLNGNALTTTPFELSAFPEAHDQADVTVTDLLGTGTMCLVWSSALPKDVNAPLRYIDLMSSKKPHIMTGYQNNMGKEVLLNYTPSTQFYLADERAGRPWVTKLHFPVQCISQTETIDHITGHRFVSSYSYHHGYFDHPEREFRGFGMVEQTDAEHFDHWVKGGASNVVPQELHQEPVVTKSWFHTGAFLANGKILTQFADDYWQAEMARQGFSVTSIEHTLDDARLIAAPGIDPAVITHFSGEEWQQALRACKGFGLRTETFAHDAPLLTPTPAQIQTQLTPYQVVDHNCTIELLQPKGQNKHAIFTVKESENLTYSYERNTSDPRIAHELNTVYDEYGNVLESAKVVYPRQAPDPTLPAAAIAAQAKSSISYLQRRYTNDVIGTDTYRLRLPSEELMFELRGVAKADNYYALNDFNNILMAATDVPYSQPNNNPAPGSPQKRLTEHTRTTYYRDNLSGELPLHQLESRGLQCEQYQLAYTPQLATHIFGTKATDALFLEGKFTHSEADANWWAPSGTARYKLPAEPLAAAVNRFFMPVGYIDPYGAETTISYVAGSGSSFISSTTDALGNTTIVDVFDFRTLQPRRLRDQNDNLTETIADELGLVKATAVFGKGSEADDLDGLQDFTDVAEAALVANFFTAATSTQLTAHAKNLLQHASQRMVYDLDAYRTTGQPAASATIVREQHFAQNAASPVQMSFEYSGGLNSVVMKKTQAEPGIAKQLTVHADNSYTITEVDTTAVNPQQLRWVGDGRTVLNNKGKAVKQYEPYFSVTHKYEDNKELVESGVTSVLYYDALDRLVRTNLPNGTFSKSLYTSWMQTDYDLSDTTLDPDCSWYSNRAGSLINAELLAEGKHPAREKQAALASAKHAGTPKVQHFDPLKRPVLQVEHNRNITTEADEFYHTLAALDVEGNLLSITDASNKVVMRHRYDMLGNLVYQQGMDNGQRWMMLNCTDDPLRTWDERGHEFQYTYDILQRPVSTRVIGGDGPALLSNVYERTFYGETEPDAKVRNVRGQVVRRYDSGGLQETPVYDFMERPLAAHRTLFKKYKEVANWTDANLTADLEPDTHTATSSFDALGRVTSQTLPDGSIIANSYNEAGMLNGKSTTSPDAIDTTLIGNIDYNEKGQRAGITYGNGVTVTFTYDKQTFRLLRLTSKRQNNQQLQDLHYTYDAMGNVTHLEDKNIPITFYNNSFTTGLSTCTYDALYRLVTATGRENSAALAFGAQDNWNDAAYLQQLSVGDPLATRTYTQHYSYDAVGNILRMEHQSTGNNWQRDYTYAPGNNQLLSTEVNGTTYNYTHHPVAGFMTAMPHLEELGWNHKEELAYTIRQKTVTGTPETTYYQYDGQGQRLRKITENAAGTDEDTTVKEERLYIADYELYRKITGVNAGLIRHTLRAMDEDHCFAMVETRGEIDDGTAPRLVRYQMQNHLGSVNLELDEDAQVITYEEYHPYGTTAYQARNADIQAAAKRYRFTGMERDEESGLSYHSARYYAPWLGRWLSTDPLGITEGTNFYLYALANPYFYKDDSGMNPNPDPTEYANFEDFWANSGPITEEYARSLWERPEPGDEIVTEQEEEYEEEYTEMVTETYTEEEDTGIRYAAVGAVTFMGGDVMVPEPTDAAPPKWIGYAVVGIAAAITIAVTSSTTVTRTRVVPRTRTRTRRRRAPLTYITYTLSNPTTGQVYVGRSMGYGTPQQIMMARYSGHHMRARGFSNPQLDQALPATRTYARRHTDPSYQAIRGREQGVIDAFRAMPRTAAGLSRSGNAINGIGLTNVRRALYMAAGMVFGPVSAPLILARHPLAAAVP